MDTGSAGLTSATVVVKLASPKVPAKTDDIYASSMAAESDILGTTSLSITYMCGTSAQVLLAPGHTAILTENVSNGSKITV